MIIFLDKGEQTSHLPPRGIISWAEKLQRKTVHRKINHQMKYLNDIREKKP